MREVSNAEWDDIQDRLKEKDAEIERMKTENNSLRLKAVEDRSLHIRAADALSAANPGWSLFHRELIAELRKAAQ